MSAEEREATLDRLAESGEPPEEEDEYEDFEPLTAEELAEVRAAADDELLAVDAAMTGRRGPGMAGSARVFPGEWASRAASFGPGMALDVTPGWAGLAVAADAAAGDDDSFAGVSDAELLGVLCAWDRVEAHAAARKLAAIAELYRRRPEPGCGIQEAGRMPGRPADPGRAARRDRPRRDGSRPGQGPHAAGAGREGRPGAAVGRGFRQRRPDGPGAAAG